MPKWHLAYTHIISCSVTSHTAKGMDSLSIPSYIAVVRLINVVSAHASKVATENYTCTHILHVIFISFKTPSV